MYTNVASIRSQLLYCCCCLVLFQHPNFFVKRNTSNAIVLFNLFELINNAWLNNVISNCSSKLKLHNKTAVTRISSKLLAFIWWNPYLVLHLIIVLKIKLMVLFPFSFIILWMTRWGKFRLEVPIRLYEFEWWILPPRTHSALNLVQILLHY